MENHEIDLNEKYGLDPEKDFEIGEELDVEILRQPSLFEKYSRVFANAERKAKTAHEKVKITKAELIGLASKEPDKYLNGGKPTAVNLESFYRGHETHKKAKKLLIQAEYERDVLKSAQQTVYLKKFTLESLLKLQTMNWFSEPKTPKDLRESIKKGSQEKVERKISEKAKKTTTTFRRRRK